MSLGQSFLSLCLVYSQVGTGKCTSALWRAVAKAAPASLKVKIAQGTEAHGGGGVRPKLLPFFSGLELGVATQLIRVSTEMGWVRRGCFSSNPGSTNVIRNTDPATQKAGDKQEVHRLLTWSIPLSFPTPIHTPGSLGATPAFPLSPMGQEKPKEVFNGGLWPWLQETSGISVWSDRKGTLPGPFPHFLGNSEGLRQQDHLLGLSN